MQSILRLIISLFLVICVFNLGYSQLRKKKEKTSSTSKKAIVQYSDGSVFTGDIIYEGTLNLKMVLATNDTINLNKVYIKRIKRGDKNISIFEGAKFHYTKGFFMSLQFGGGFDNRTSQAVFIAGYRFNKKLAAGLGFGAVNNTTTSFNTWIDASTIPLFAYARFYPFDKKVKPFVAGSLGYGFRDNSIFGTDHTGGLFLQPEIGINFSSRRRLRFTLSLAQQFHHIRGSSFFIDQFSNPVTTNFNLWFNRTILKIGFEWK